MIKGNSQNFEAFWVKYDNYKIFEYNNEFYIKPSDKSEDNVYNLFDVSSELLVDFFLIGKEVAENWDHRDIHCELKSKEKKYQDLVLEFVKKYGLLGEVTYMPINDNFISDNKVLLPGINGKTESSLNEYLKIFFEYDKKIDFNKELSKDDLIYLFGKNGNGTATYLHRLNEYALTFSEIYTESSNLNSLHHTF